MTQSMSTTQPTSPSGYRHVCLQLFTGQTFHKSCLFSLFPSSQLLFTRLTPIWFFPYHSRTTKITGNLSMSPNPKDVFYHLTWQFRSTGNHSLFKISWLLAFIKWLSPSSLNSPPSSLQVQHSISSEYILKFLHMSSSYTSPVSIGSVTHNFTSPNKTCFINSRSWYPLWTRYTLRYLKWTSIS